jgi:DNA-binding response OmpR family regulator
MERNMVETMHQLTALVVDDDEAIRRLLDIYLGSRGYRVVCAADGEQGIELMRRDVPDIVLLDGMLTGMDGWDVCRHMREMSNVPILILSGRAQHSDREKGLAAGADGYITKPVSLKELTMRIDEALSRRQADSE